MNNSFKLSIVLITVFSLLVVSVLFVQIQNQGQSIEVLEQQIKNLYEENIDLKDTDEYLIKEINRIERQLNTQTDRVKELIEEKTQLEEQLEELKKENEQLKRDLQARRNTTNSSGSSGSSNNQVVTSNPHVVRGNTPTQEKIAFLTFDDGPSRNTERILNTLKEYDIQATFFVNANTTEFGRRMYRRMIEEGHAIGNHTYSHNYSKIYRSVDAFFEDFMQKEDFLYETVGVRPKIVRFPGGTNNQVSWRYGGREIMGEISQELLKRGYSYFDWNVDSRDASTALLPKDQIVSSVINGVQGKNTVNILFHDSHGKTTTADALPEILDKLIEMGYSFEVITPNSFAPRFL